MKPLRSSVALRASRSRTVLLAGASITAVGLALAGTIAPAVGTTMLAVGWIVFALGLHNFGRG